MSRDTCRVPPPRPSLEDPLGGNPDCPVGRERAKTPAMPRGGRLTLGPPWEWPDPELRNGRPRPGEGKGTPLRLLGATQDSPGLSLPSPPLRAEHPTPPLCRLRIAHGDPSPCSPRAGTLASASISFGLSAPTAQVPSSVRASEHRRWTSARAFPVQVRFLSPRLGGR